MRSLLSASFCLMLAGLINQPTFSAENAPDWTVRTPEQGKLSAEDWQNENVLLVFHRGVTCVHCMQQLKNLADEYAEFQNRDIEILAISQSLPNGSGYQQLRSSKGIEFPMAYDSQMQVFRKFDCLGRGNRPMHGLFLINGEQEIVWSSVTNSAITDVDRILRSCDQSLQ